MNPEEVVYSRPPGWKPTPKQLHNHILSKAGLKVGSIWGFFDPAGFTEVKHKND